MYFKLVLDHHWIEGYNVEPLFCEICYKHTELMSGVFIRCKDREVALVHRAIIVWFGPLIISYYLDVLLMVSTDIIEKVMSSSDMKHNTVLYRWNLCTCLCAFVCEKSKGKWAGKSRTETDNSN